MTTIKKAQANFDNGTSYEVLHYETQLGQVKVMDASGNPVSDLKETLFDGKLLSDQDLNAIKTTGKYRIKGGVNLPTGVVATNTYIFNVDAVDIGDKVIVAHQELYDHINHAVYHRTINGTTIGSWVKLGKEVADQVAKIGNLSNLYTINKNTIVDAINSLSAELQVVTDINQAKLQDEIDNLDTRLTSHNHDSRYLQLSGGSLTNTISVANEKSVAGKNTSGGNLNLAKVNGTNDIVLGDSLAKTIIESKSGDISLSDGKDTYKVFHSGNDGHGSGMDSDTVDGLHGNQIARRDTGNTFTGDQVVGEGKSIYLKAVGGSSQAGSLNFRDGDNAQKARIGVDVNGNMNLYGGRTLGLTVESSGDTQTTHDHILNAKDRQVAVRFKLNDSDVGAGIYMNNTSKQLGMYDWEKKSWYFTTDRAKQIVQFYNSIEIQGRRLSIQTSAPSSPSTGDVWIDI